MKIISAADAYKNLTNGIRRKTFTIPPKSDPQCHDGYLFPKLNPKFKLDPGEKIFTIGSCFARNIESLLLASGMNVPVAQFGLPEGEFHLPHPHILNEYNAGTILQRVESVVGLFKYDDDMGIEETPKGAVDLFLHIHAKPVPLDRALARRREIAALYAELRDADTVIITLGLIECWFDTKYNCYLNKAPSKALAAKEPGRFEFRRLDVEDVSSRMRAAINLLNNIGHKKIIITVSPVPIEATFTEQHAIVSNSYSKAILRVVCEQLTTEFDNVDYFPSFEMVTSGGIHAMGADNIHIHDNVVAMVTNYMISLYSETTHQQPESKSTAGIMADYWEGIRAVLDFGDADMGEEIAKRMLEAYPEAWQGYDVMGHAVYARGDLEQSVQLVEVALSKDPTNAGLLSRLAFLHDQRATQA